MARDMAIIPVIDVRGGLAVAAEGGDRQAYRRLRTPLASTCDPVAVAKGLSARYAFETLYVADLDAIEGTGENQTTISALQTALPHCQLWVDAGVSTARNLDAFRRQPGLTCVAGSETLQDATEFERIKGVLGARVVLSLDFKGEMFLGDETLLARSDCWTQQVIAMALAAVGSQGGPDLSLVSRLVRAGDGRAVFAAGGVRNDADLEALKAAGARGVLVATALHAGLLTAGLKKK